MLYHRQPAALFRIDGVALAANGAQDAGSNLFAQVDDIDGDQVDARLLFVPDVFYQNIFAHHLTAVEQQKSEKFEFKPGERAGPAANAADAGEAIQFNVSVPQDQRGNQSLHFFSAHLMHVVGSPAAQSIACEGLICEQLCHRDFLSS